MEGYCTQRNSLCHEMGLCVLLCCSSQRGYVEILSSSYSHSCSICCLAGSNEILLYFGCTIKICIFKHVCSPHWCLHREFPVVRSEQERPVLYLEPRPPDAALYHTVPPRRRDGAALCLSWRSLGYRSLRSCPHPHFISQLLYRNWLDIIGPQPAWWENFLSIDKRFISGSHASYIFKLNLNSCNLRTPSLKKLHEENILYLYIYRFNIIFMKIYIWVM